LETIGKIEVEEGLPHPTLDGVWAKISPSATLSYLITDFSEANFDDALELCRKMGLKYLYLLVPFQSTGHYILNRNLFPKGEESLKKCVEKAKKWGIRVGFHSGSETITSNDPYITPKPDPRLAGLGSSQLVQDIDESAKEIPIADAQPFKKVVRSEWDRKFVLIDEEIIEFKKVSESNPPRLLECTRGAFGTKISPHKKGAEVRRLATAYNEVFFPGVKNGMMDEIAKRLADLINNCGIKQTSFDCLGNYSGGNYFSEGDYSDERGGIYVAQRFVKTCYDNWKEKDVINDASCSLHFLWHIHTRHNWGEPTMLPWMEESYRKYRWSNQEYFDRNFYPHMMGWFAFHSASDQSEATTLEEMEFMLSKCAGWNAGFGLLTSLEEFRTNGQGESVIYAIREWEEARHLGAFTEEQKKMLINHDWWHLEKVGEKRWLLFPLDFSPKFNYPGEGKGLAEWHIENRYKTQPLRFLLRVLPDETRETTVSNPRFEANGSVLTFPIQLKPNQYLVCEGKEEGLVYDCNWNLITKVKGVGSVPLIPEGDAIVRFSCELEGGKSPSLWVKFKTIGESEEVFPFKK
jgi:hypothetical protein